MSAAASAGLSFFQYFRQPCSDPSAPSASTCVLQIARTAHWDIGALGQLPIGINNGCFESVKWAASAVGEGPAVVAQVRRHLKAQSASAKAHAVTASSVQASLGLLA